MKNHSSSYTRSSTVSRSRTTRASPSPRETYTQSGTYRRLRSLEDDGYLDRRPIGNNTLWKLTEAYLDGELDGSA